MARAPSRRAVRILTGQAAYVAEITIPMPAPQSVGPIPEILVLEGTIHRLARAAYAWERSVREPKSMLVEHRQVGNVRPKPGRLNRQHADESIVNALFPE